MTARAADPIVLQLGVKRMREASPALWRFGLAFLALFAASLCLSFVDPRHFNGISTWVKPAKFALSLSLHMLTVAAALLLLPQPIRHGLRVRAAVSVIVAMSVFEQIYITFRAARAEASHFNVAEPLTRALYSLMGLGAVAIMLATAVIGWQILRHGSGSLLARATGTGFLAASLLTIVIGLTLGGMTSHWIGGDRTDATGLPMLGWSTTGGDLRVSHFLGLHLMQAMPLLATFRREAIVWSGLAAGVALTMSAYLQALFGFPLLTI